MRIFKGSGNGRLIFFATQPNILFATQPNILFAVQPNVLFAVQPNILFAVQPNVLCHFSYKNEICLKKNAFA